MKFNIKNSIVFPLALCTLLVISSCGSKDNHSHNDENTKEIFKDYDIYVHSPKEEQQHDGSSGGIADTICILSAVKNIPVPHNIAFTGSVTLKGRIMRIGGVKAKVLAAQRHKMKTIVLPLGNKKDVDELPSDIVGNMEFKYFENMTDVYHYVFGTEATTLARETEAAPQGHSQSY